MHDPALLDLTRLLRQGDVDAGEALAPSLSAGSTRPKASTRRDLHFRVSERQYQLLLEMAQASDETIAAFMRRHLRSILAPSGVR
jgi:hypothetical protein